MLLAGVVSLDRADEEIWDEYKTKAIEYLKNKYG
ncbi:TPA: mobilization protein, partial [Enterobacter hormaechei]|nr:mobilization protein [Enterobacter hormaechei]